MPAPGSGGIFRSGALSVTVSKKLSCAGIRYLVLILDTLSIRFFSSTLVRGGPVDLAEYKLWKLVTSQPPAKVVGLINLNRSKNASVAQKRVYSTTHVKKKLILRCLTNKTLSHSLGRMSYTVSGPRVQILHRPDENSPPAAAVSQRGRLGERDAGVSACPASCAASALVRRQHAGGGRGNPGSARVVAGAAPRAAPDEDGEHVAQFRWPRHVAGVCDRGCRGCAKVGSVRGAGIQ